MKQVLALLLASVFSTLFLLPVGAEEVAPAELQPRVGLVYRLTGTVVGKGDHPDSRCLPVDSTGVWGDYGLYYYACYRGELYPMTYFPEEKEWRYTPEGSNTPVVIAPWAFAEKGSAATKAIYTKDAYPVIGFRFPEKGMIRFYFKGNSNPKNSASLFVTRNGIKDSDWRFGAGIDTLAYVEEGEMYYFHCKPVSSGTEGYAAPISFISYAKKATIPPKNPKPSQPETDSSSRPEEAPANPGSLWGWIGGGVAAVVGGGVVAILIGKKIRK
ncbi:MAG: hypothetical protein E7486_02135 [Ruminococcaceae bacterium]|nr:hypothetical protein [Oscillospiraceae bacterium]